MKKIILFITILQFTLLSFGGRGLIKETKGKEYKSRKSDAIFGFDNAIKIDKDYYVIGRKIDMQYISVLVSYLARSKPSDFIIYKLDAKMNVKAVNVIPSEFNGKEVMSYTLTRLGDRLCALFYFNNMKVRKQYLFAQEIDIRTLETLSSLYKVGEVSITKTEKRLPCLFRVDVSQDYSKMLIMADRANLSMSKKQKKTARAQKSHTFSYWLIDADYNLINASQKVKIGKGHTIVAGQTFDNQGNMCFLALEENKVARPKKKKGNSEKDEETDLSQSRLIMKIIRPDDTETELVFAGGENFYSAMMTLNPVTGNVAVVGLLASGKYGAKGIYTQQVNLSTGEILAETSQKFGTELAKEINDLKPLGKSKSKRKADQESKKSKKEKAIEKKNPTPIDYIPRLVRLGACHYNEENELVIIAQKYHTYTVTYTTYDSKGMSHTTTITYYVYGDIIPFKLNSEGEIENFGFVPHYEEYTVNKWKDYNSLYADKKLFLISRLEACHVELNNKVSKTEKLKEMETYRKKHTFAEYVKVSDSEMLYILNRKRVLTFNLLTVKTDK